MHKYIICAVALLSICALSCKGPEGPVGPPGPAGSDVLTNPNIQPEVIWTYPANRSIGPYYDNAYQIYIRFNKIMDVMTVLRAVSIMSPGTGIYIDTSNSYFMDGATFYFYPRDSTSNYYYKWQISKQYTLTISTSAKDVNGNNLSQPCSLTFKPEPYFRVVYVSPNDGSTNVAPANHIYLEFNSPVTSNIFSSIQLSPLTNGQWSVYSSDSLEIGFEPSINLNIATTYTIVVNTTAQDRYGNQLGRQFTSSFTTAPFQVSYTSPSNGVTGVSTYSSISIQFNAIIDTGSVLSAFSMPGVSGSFSMYDGSQYFYFNPYPNLATNTTYSVTISTAMRAKGGAYLATPYTFSFTTGN